MCPADAPLDSKNLSLLWASPDRAEEIAALHAQLFDPAWDAASITESIEHPASASFIAQVRDPRSLAGFIIGRIAAEPEFQERLLREGGEPEPMTLERIAQFIRTDSARWAKRQSPQKSAKTG